jgi:hypothetical protein
MTYKPVEPVVDMPDVPHYVWKKIQADEIKVKDVVYTPSTKTRVHFGFVTSIKENKVTGKWSNIFEHIWIEKSRDALNDMHFYRDDSDFETWFRLESIDIKDDEYEAEIDEPPFSVKIIEKREE